MNQREVSERIQLAISQLPTYSYRDTGRTPTKTVDGSTHDSTSCSICIESFTEAELVKILPCFHQFHSKCVDDWLLRKSTCPVCKYDIGEFNEDAAIMASAAEP